ncbi:hypothetical protein Tco_0891621 [Tanacetum coccineum]|uniref:Uncharacterized protein n=1 Tax=Tanacetum coccineum TaxID=301880 RepID=A0ABQ5C9I7_9ASTR
MKEFMTIDQANYYSGITSITVNGKNAYELKGKFLDDLHNNAYSGTYREDAVEHIEYFLKIVDPIDFPNKAEVKKDPTNNMFEEWLASKFANHMVMDPFTMNVLQDFLKKNDSHDRVISDGISDLKEANNDDEQEIDPKLFTYDVERIETYDDYMNELTDELDEPWSEDGVPYEIDDEKYVAIKEDDYDDLTSTSEEA